MSDRMLVRTEHQDDNSASATKRVECANYENTHETGLQEESYRYDVNIIFQTNDSSLFSSILV